MKTNTVMTEALYKERDLWKEARDLSANFRGSWFLRLWITLLSWLFPVKVPAIYTFGDAQRVMCVDLNKYRQGVNVEMLIDQGVRVFMLRVGGPTQWVYGDERYEIDATFTEYHQRIRAYAKLKGIRVWIMGYWVHNPWSNEEGNYLGIDPQVKMFKEATRNHLCDLYCWDDEVATIWKSGKEITCTATNLVKSISICMEQTWNEFERWPNGLHKMVVHYSANWYMKRYAQSQYQVWLDNANKDVNNRKLMTWRAWIPVVFSEVFATIGALFDKAITPTGTQENAYLRMGSELAADFWQLTFTALGAWCGYANGKMLGIDASIGYGPCVIYSDFLVNANLPLEDEEEEPEDPETPAGDYVTTTVFNEAMTALQTQLGGIKERIERHLKD